ncbi:MAG: hypothetical protein FD136_1189 [Chitinophagaceae bacterium]|nr:MAG: hypothetical protein FD136_1189 [Chitinophagaceae bacterium]
MSVSLVTFSTPAFYYARHTLLMSAKKYRIDHSHAYTMNDFSKTDFYLKYKNITDQKRGAGYWLWKPYYILQHLNKLHENDILIYCDSGLDIIDSLSPLIELVRSQNSGILLFENYQGSGYFNRTSGFKVNEENIYIEMNKCKYWTKRDAFILMGADSSEYWDAAQTDACFQIYRKTETSLKFVREWLAYCCNEQILTDTPNLSGKENFDNFFGHIHDQTIVSLLAKKYQLDLFRCPSQFGNHFKLPKYRIDNEFKMLPYCSYPKQNSKYGQILNHHRIRFSAYYFRWRYFLGQEKQIAIGWFSRLFLNV